MPNLSPERLFLATGVITSAVFRAWWLAFVVFTVIDLGLSPIQLVLLGTVMEATVLVCEIPTGVVADLYSRKWSVVISFWILGLGLAASGLVDSFIPLVLTQMLWGFGYTFQSGADVAWITDHVGVAKAEQLLIRRGKLDLIGAAGGLVIGALLANFTSVRVVIVCTGALLAIWGFVLAAMMTEKKFKRERADTWRSFFAELADGGRTAWNQPALRVLVFVVASLGLANESLDRLGVRRLDQVGFSDRTDEVLALTLMGIAAAVFGALILSAVEDRATGKNIPLIFGLLVAVTAVCAAALSWAVSLPIAIAAVVTRDSSNSAAWPLVQAWTNAHASEKHRATTHSFIGQALAMGELAGGIALGALATGLSVAFAIGISAILLLAGALISVRGRLVWDAH